MKNFPSVNLDRFKSLGVVFNLICSHGIVHERITSGNIIRIRVCFSKESTNRLSISIRRNFQFLFLLLVLYMNRIKYF